MCSRGKRDERGEGSPRTAYKGGRREGNARKGEGAEGHRRGHPAIKKRSSREEGKAWTRGRSIGAKIRRKELIASGRYPEFCNEGEIGGKGE